MGGKSEKKKICRFPFRFSSLTQHFWWFFFLERLKTTRRYFSSRDQDFLDKRGAGYGHSKPPKMAPPCEVLMIPKKVKYAFAYFLLRRRTIIIHDANAMLLFFFSIFNFSSSFPNK